MPKKRLVAAPLTPLFISVFRLNGALIAAGDRMVEDLGLTSARWQVLGVIANVPAPLSVASIARTIGLTRQGVRGGHSGVGGVRTGRVQAESTPSPAQLVVLTEKGKEVEHAARLRQVPWATALGKGLKAGHIEEAATLLQTVLARLEWQANIEHGEL